MRTLLSLCALTLAAVVYAQTPQAPAPPQGGTLKAPTILSPDVTPTIYACRGLLTSVTILTDKPLDGVMAGGPEINLLREGNVIHVQPAVPEGMSSITFRVEGVVYVIRVRIVMAEPLVQNPVFTFAHDSRFGDLDKAISSAPAMKPSDIDINGAVKVIERATNDPEFRQRLKHYAALPLRKRYQWNGNAIHLMDAHQFADLDLILIRIVWVNQTDQALYLNQGQYRLFIGDRPIPTQARRQDAPRSIVFPGQREVVWLAVQGYKLRLDQEWEIRLPREASELRAYIRTN